MDKNIYAAIAMALYEYQGNNVHDREPSVITIKPKPTLWNAKFCLSQLNHQDNERIQIYHRRQGV